MFKDKTSFFYKVKISLYFNLAIHLLLEALVSWTESNFISWFQGWRWFQQYYSQGFLSHSLRLNSEIEISWSELCDWSLLIKFSLVLFCSLNMGIEVWHKSLFSKVCYQTSWSTFLWLSNSLCSFQGKHMRLTQAIITFSTCNNYF